MAGRRGSRCRARPAASGAAVTRSPSRSQCYKVSQSLRDMGYMLIWEGPVPNFMRRESNNFCHDMSSDELWSSCALGL